MRARRLLGLAGLMTGLLAVAPAAHADDVTTGYVVTMAPGSTDATTDAASAAVKTKPTLRYHGAFAGFSTTMTSAQASRLADQPGVLLVEPDQEFVGAGKPAPAAPAPEVLPPGIRRVGGLLDGLPRSASRTGVAIVDTGLALTSPELNAYDGVNCVTAGAPAQDDNGHGTSVGGVVGARAGNAIGTVGIAPGTPLYAVKVLNKRNSGTLSQVLCGLDWLAANAAARNIGVVNLSLAAAGSDDGDCGRTNGEALHRAICALTAQGILVVAAAGNASSALEKTVPAAYPEVLTVTATADTDGVPGGTGPVPACVRGEADDRYASFSNFATTDAAAAHTVAAPGVCVLSTGLTAPTSTYYGTSSAAPHAAGVAALCLDDGGLPGPCAGLTPAQMITRLRADALAGSDGFLGDPLRPVAGKRFGPLLSAAAY